MASEPLNLIPLEHQDTVVPLRRKDGWLEHLQWRADRYYDQWELAQDIAAEKPELRGNPTWQGLVSSLANLADNAFLDVAEYSAGQGGGE